MSAYICIRDCTPDRPSPGCPVHAPDQTPWLTPDEHAAVEALGEAWNAVVKVVVAGGNPDTFDTHELVPHMHALQNAVLANAAARAYPGTYRMLGGKRAGT